MYGVQNKAMHHV